MTTQREAEKVTNNVRELNLRRELFTNTSSYFIGILSPNSKHLLTLPQEERAGSAFFDLLAEMENIEFFKMFNSRTKESLANALKFVTHRADEYLLVQGEAEDPPQALYVIMSGVVTEHYRPSVGTSDDPNKIAWPEKILRKGEFFGHVDIIYNRIPTVNAQTVGYCELLVLSREDFDIVRTQIEARCTRAVHYLYTIEAIRRFGWSDDEYKVLEIYSNLCTYAEGQDVYSGDKKNKPFWSYFVVLGECKVARELAYYVTDSGRMLSATRDSGTETARTSKVMSERLVFEEAKQGYYFGVGENFEGNHIIASSNLECLLIPRLLLVYKNRELLKAMAKDLTDSLPSDQEVLDSHSNLVAASQKKVEMIKELFKNKNLTNIVQK